MSQRQRREHRELFYSPKASDTLVFQRAIAGKLRDSAVRGVCWRFFLGALAGPPDGWPAQVRAQQTAFDALCAEHCVELDLAVDAAASDDVSLNNPLSVDEASPFAKYFAGQTLREEIGRDLERLHPGDAFFEQPAVQKLMLRVLFVWCRSNPELSYRQGMHELLAPCVAVLWAEAAEAAKARGAPATPAGAQPPLRSAAAASGPPPYPPSWPADEATDEVAQKLHELLRVEHVEAACWALFCKLMGAVRGWFEHTPRPPAGVAKVALAEPPLSQLQRKCELIQEGLLRQLDPALHVRLGELGIEPQLYLLRWLRLLFGREFHVEDVKLLWDALFAFGADDGGGGGGGGGGNGPLALVDYVALAMLVYVRHDLLTRDYAFSMRRLLKFPPMEDVHFLVQRALQLKRTASKTLGGGGSGHVARPPAQPPMQPPAPLPVPSPAQPPVPRASHAPATATLPPAPAYDPLTATPVGAAAAPFKLDVPARPPKAGDSATGAHFGTASASFSPPTSPASSLASSLASTPPSLAAPLGFSALSHAAPSAAPSRGSSASRGSSSVLDELLAAPVPVLPPLRKSESAAHPSVVSSACATSAAFITSSPLSAGSSSLSTSPLGGKAFGSSDSSSAAASRSARLAARMGSALEALHAELGAERHPRLRSALDDLEACRRELLQI